MNQVIDVAVAIICNDNGEILVNQRQDDKEHAGFWEFPGGKFDLNESASQALQRECLEELGIEITSDSAFLELTHDYPGKTVHLHVRLVERYMQTIKSMEGQLLSWKTIQELLELEGLLPADRPIVVALKDLFTHSG